MQHAPCPILKMSINRASIIFGLALWLICVAIGFKLSSITYRLLAQAKEEAICSVPDFEHERQ